MAVRPKVALICLGGGDVLEDHLVRRGHQVCVVDEMWAAESTLSAGGIDVAVLGDGISMSVAFDLLRTHARLDGPLFVLVWRATALVERVLALELGAADVVDAAATTRELAARIVGLAARRSKGKSDLLVLERATVDLRSALVMHQSGAEEQLSAGQVALVRLFLANPGKVLTRDDIVAAAPAENADAFDRSIDSRIVRLRRKLDTSSIATIRGSGYRFDPPVI
ncbi:MAG: winged helix-turn-helix domain-containing protein [Rhizobiaceae bacterium]